MAEIWHVRLSDGKRSWLAKSFPTAADYETGCASRLRPINFGSRERAEARARSIMKHKAAGAKFLRHITNAEAVRPWQKPIVTESPADFQRLALCYGR